MFTLSAPLPSTTRKPIEGRHFTKKKKKKTSESVCFFPKERWAPRGKKRGDGFVVRSTDSEDAARKLLGISDNDDALAVQQAVNKKKMLYKGDNEKLKEVEAAYDTLQQASLQARLSGKKCRVAVGVECGSNSIEMATAMVPFTEQRFVRKL